MASAMTSATTVALVKNENLLSKKGAAYSNFETAAFSFGMPAFQDALCPIILQEGVSQKRTLLLDLCYDNEVIMA